MGKAWGRDNVIRPADCPPSSLLQERFRRCRCGTVTFLDGPCRTCGRTDLTPVFVLAERRSRRDGQIRLLGCVVSLVVGLFLLSCLWLPLLIPGIVVAVVALWPAPGWTAARRIHRCYWLFHRKKPGLFHQGDERLADPDVLQEMMDAYDSDLRYLEQRLEKTPDAETAEQVFAQAHILAGIYHNRKVSGLMMKCLLLVPVSEGICLDMEEVCAHLHVEDFPKPEEVLAKVHDCVLLTCLCPGERTARFVVWYCAVRVQQVQYSRNPESTVEKAAGDLSALASWFSDKEKTMLSDIWLRSAVGLPAPDKEAKELSRWNDDKTFQDEKEFRLGMVSQESFLLALYWFDHVWYERNSTMSWRFRKLIRTGASSFGAKLAARWGCPDKKGE